MEKLFDITQFDKYKEDNRREVKKANGGLPNDMWETYSAYANTYGGVIILGVKELDDKHWKTTGLKVADKEKLLDNLWNLLHNPNKVNVNLLSESDVEIYEVGEDIIIVIEVPTAKRSQKPVYINNDMFNQTYRRRYSGDYKCTRLQVKAMLRDQTENTVDMDVLDNAEMSDLNMETLQGYRNRHRILKPGHPFEKCDDSEYLRSICAAAISDEDKQLHPTAAGMLMFGNEFNIVRHFPEYFLDYREVLDPTIRWTDRLQSSTGEWSGNVCDFYFRVYNKIIKDIKIPFKTKGGESDPRNKALMKMFNMINIGERAGSGVPNIFNVWEDEGWVEPVIEERFNPDRTILSIEFKKRSGDKKAAIKSGDKKVTKKTQMQYDKILKYMEADKEYSIQDFCELLELKESRTKDILKGLTDYVETTGSNKNRRYRRK